LYIFFFYLKDTERQERAFYLSLAAILGDGIYNFGELLMHPILNALNGTRDQWLVDLLFAFNRGDLDKFETYRQFWTLQVTSLF
jgi:26S proteasome regulatory subunit N9